MGLRIVANRWHWRFVHSGQEYTASTGLAATEQNRPKAEAKEAKARALVEIGQGDTLKVKPRRFSDAMDAWLEWAKGEHRETPATYRRLKGSSNSLKVFFGKMNVSAVTAGKIEDYKTWRRSDQPGEKPGEVIPGVQEVTIRHDLHALSGFLRYSRKQRWLVGNPLEDVEIPSDKDAVRIHPLTSEEEKRYFACALNRKLWDLHDLGRLMIQQGCRPEEFFELPWRCVDLEAGTMRIEKGKSLAARRTLRLTAESREILARRLQAAQERSGLRGATTPLLAGQQPQGAGNPRYVWVFPSPKRPGRHLLSVQTAHEAVIEETGLSFVIYDFRHTFATRAVPHTNLPALAAIMGHANLRSIMKYVHIQQPQIDAAMADIEAGQKQTTLFATSNEGEKQEGTGRVQ